MADLDRLSFSIEQPLLEQLEKLREETGYANRSDFLRDMIRGRLVDRAWELDHDGVGTNTLVFDHHALGLDRKVTDLQHDGLSMSSAGKELAQMNPHMLSVSASRLVLACSRPSIGVARGSSVRGHEHRTAAAAHRTHRRDGRATAPEVARRAHS